MQLLEIASIVIIDFESCQFVFLREAKNSLIRYPIFSGGYDMRDLIVRLTHKTYPIQIGNGCFSDAAAYIQSVFPGRKVFIVTDRNIASIYGEKLVDQLREKNVEAGIYVIPAGENSKSHHELMNLYNAFAASGITRKDAIVALGGGVTGDLTGYAASTWLR